MICLGGHSRRHISGHVREHFIMYCTLEGYSRRHFIMFSFCSQKGNYRGHLITFFTLEGHPSEHFITLCPLGGHLEGHSLH